MRAWFSLAAILATLLMACESAAADETILIFGDDNYPPIIWAEKGEARGELPRILRELEPRLGRRFVIEQVPWRRAYESALSGQGGLIGVSMNSERQKLFDFSEPVYDDSINVVTLRGREFPFRELADLHGRQLGGQLGASYGEAFDAALKRGVVSVERDTSQVIRLRKLLAGRIGAALIGNGRAGLDQTIAADALLSQNRDRFVALERPLAVDKLYLAFPKSMKATEFLQQFNTALRSAPLPQRQ